MPRTGNLRYIIRLIGINVALTGALLVAALAIAEAYLRLTIPASSRDSISEPTRSSKRYKVMKRDSQLISWGSELRTNRLGFRDDDAEIPAKLATEIRLLVLGDSFTVSAGVDYDSISTTLIEKRLRERVPETTVINLAVGGYNIIQQDLVLEEVGLALNPDAVVVAVFPFNDLSSEDYRASRADAEGTAPATTLPWYRKLYVYRALLSKIEARVRSLLGPGGSDAGVPVEDTTAETDARENLLALEHLVEDATRHRLPVLVVLLPNTDDFESQRGSFAPFVELCQLRRWTCSNLIDRFIGSGAAPRSLRLNLLDSHPNEAYNEMVAEFVAADLAPLVQGLRQQRDAGAGPAVSTER